MISYHDIISWDDIIISYHYIIFRVIRNNHGAFPRLFFYCSAPSKGIEPNGTFRITCTTFQPWGLQEQWHWKLTYSTSAQMLIQCLMPEHIRLRGAQLRARTVWPTTILNARQNMQPIFFPTTQMPARSPERPSLYRTTRSTTRQHSWPQWSNVSYGHSRMIKKSTFRWPQ